MSKNSNKQLKISWNDYQKITKIVLESRKLDSKLISQIIDEIKNKLDDINKKQKRTNEPCCLDLIFKDNFGIAPLKKVYGASTKYVLKSGTVRYITVWIDSFNFEALGYFCHSNEPDDEFMAYTVDSIASKHDIKDCILHTSNKWYFNSEIYQNTVKKHQALQSIADAKLGNRNAVATSFFSALKTEFLDSYEAKQYTIKAFEQELDYYMNWYNNKRMIMRTGKSPLEYKNDYYKSLKTNQYTKIN